VATTTVSSWRDLLESSERGVRDYRVWLVLLVLTAASLWFYFR
jgi:hypothetical protein